jgi:general secretion pathway protein B
MSFILDALKKSETDRQRQNGPALFEVKVAPPRSGLPLWAVALAVLLAVNLVIVGWMLLRHPAPAPAEAAAATTKVPEANAVAAASPPSAGTVVAATPAVAPQGQQAPPATALSSPVAAAAPAAPLGQTAGTTQPAPAYAPSPAAPPAGNANPNAPGGAPTVAAIQGDPAGKPNPDDYAPAAEPGIVPGFGNHVSRGTESGVPLYQDAALAQGAQLPELRLDLHVFAAKPQDRFVMINMKKLHEGDSLPDGVRVESITPDGAVLSHNGSKFLLPRD